MPSGNRALPTLARLAAAVAIASLAAGVVPAETGIDATIEERPRVNLRIVPVVSDLRSGGDSTRGAARELEIRPGGPVEAEIPVAWPLAAEPAVLRLEVTLRPGEAGEPHALTLGARLELAGGRPIRALRQLQVADRTTAVFEVHRTAEHALTLLLDATADTEIVVSRGVRIGPPVQFRLEIQRVLEGRVVVLEENTLNTFVGQSVFYDFKLGDGPDADAGRVTLKPVRLAGGVAEIEVDVSGRLPRDEDVHVAARHERWLASRGASTTIAFEVGDPPDGYRFVVRAVF